MGARARAFQTTLTLYGLHLHSAPDERIADGALFTFANGNVIDDRTFGPFAACISARIGTFTIYAGQTTRTFGIHSALGATIRRDTLVFRQT